MGLLGTVILIVEIGAAEVVVEEVLVVERVGFGKGIEGGVNDKNLFKNFTPMLR